MIRRPRLRLAKHINYAAIRLIRVILYGHTNHVVDVDLWVYSGSAGYIFPPTVIFMEPILLVEFPNRVNGIVCYRTWYIDMSVFYFKLGYIRRHCDIMNNIYHGNAIE